MSSSSSNPHADEVLPNAAKVYRVTHKDLPLSCPMPNMTLWNSHPRVYLPIAKTGKERCPYCSAEYILTDAPHHE